MSLTGTWPDAAEDQRTLGTDTGAAPRLGGGGGGGEDCGVGRSQRGEWGVHGEV